MGKLVTLSGRLAASLACVLGIASLCLAQGASATTPVKVFSTATTSPTVYEASPGTTLTKLTAVQPPPQAVGPTWQVTTAGVSQYMSYTALKWPTSAAIALNDRLQLTMWYRSVVDSPVDKFLQVVVCDPNNTGTRIMRAQIYNPTTTWQKIEIGFTSFSSWKAGAMSFQVWMGSDIQNFQMGPVTIMDYGPSYPVWQLRNTVRYGGSHPNAAWRQAAADRINTYRTGVMNVNVIDGSGNPVPGATVNASMTKNAFQFGSCIQAWGIGSSVDPTNRYQATFLQNFNAAVFENDTKWAQYINGWKEWTGTNNSSLAGAITFLQQNGISLRGHNLIWPTMGFIGNSYWYMPMDLTSATPAATLRSRIDSHFQAVLTDSFLNNKFTEWDVLNEPYTNVQVQGRIGTGLTPQASGILGNAEMVRLYTNFAKWATPGTKAYLNDYSTIEAYDPVHIAYDQALVQYIRANGGKVDGVGLQSHFTGGSPGSMDQLASILQNWSDQNVELKVTEYDMDGVGDGVEQFLTDYLTLCYSMPSMKGFMVWGFWQGMMYQTKSALYDSNWNLTPSGVAWQQKVLKDWNTQASAFSDSNGNASIRGHAGSYIVTVTANGLKATKNVTLTASGASFTVQLQ